MAFKRTELRTFTIVKKKNVTFTVVITITKSKHILLNGFSCSIAEYFDDPASQNTNNE